MRKVKVSHECPAPVLGVVGRGEQRRAAEAGEARHVVCAGELRGARVEVDRRVDVLGLLGGLAEVVESRRADGIVGRGAVELA